MARQSASKCRHFGSRPSLTGNGSRAGCDVTSIKAMILRFAYLLVSVGKAGKVVRKKC